MRRNLLIVLGLAGAAATLFVILASTGAGPSSHSPPLDVTVSTPPFAAATFVCSLGSSDGVQEIGIVGLDGGVSLPTPDAFIWLFGDTFVESGGFVHAPVARSTDVEASDCLDLEFRQSFRRPLPMFSLEPGETTAWSEGALATPSGTVYFYYSAAVRTSDTQWYVDHVGLGELNSKTLKGKRIAELWIGDELFGSNILGARSPVLVDNQLHVFLYTADGRHLLARASLDSLRDVTRYQYWDGRAFRPDPSAAVPMWLEEPSLVPAHNGASVTYEPALGRWLALSVRELTIVQARVAPAISGPWSAPIDVLDCRTVSNGVWPVCYSAELHPYLSKGSTQYFTLGIADPYDVWLFKVRLIGPITDAMAASR